MNRFLKTIGILVVMGLLLAPFFSVEGVSVGISATVEEIAEPTPPGGGAGPIPPKPPAIVVFQGQAYPSAFITILKNGQTAATLQGDSLGVFEKELTGLRAGTYKFSFWAEDTDGRRSTTISFSLTLVAATKTTISDILLPPTIELDKDSISQGEKLNILGQATPNSQVNIIISPTLLTKSTNVGLDGRWRYSFDTSSLEPGLYSVRARTITSTGLQSSLSGAISFTIKAVWPPPPPPPPPPEECAGADLNFDGRVDLVDFSILLYWWGTSQPENICIDINIDGIVDLIDFSIMLYYWSG